MMLEVVLASALGLAGLVLLGLGMGFFLMTWPYLRLLSRAGREVVEIYNGVSKGDVWEVAVSVGTRTEKHWVEAKELSRFLIRHALGDLYERESAKAKAIEAEAEAALSERLLWQWVQVPNMGFMHLDKKPNLDFNSSRREILDQVGMLLSGRVALRARWGLLAD